MSQPSSIDACARCGACVRACPARPLTRGAELDPAELLEQLDAHVATPTSAPLSAAAADWVAGCLECFRCEAVCPQGARPLRRIEQAKAGLDPPVPIPATTDPASPYQQALAGLPAATRRRLTTPRIAPAAEVVFFPGCNAYLQPELVALMLDVLDRVEVGYSFIPGLSHCCGDAAFFAGDRAGGKQRMQALLAEVAHGGASTLLLWCPTCLCRLHLEKRGVEPSLFRTSLLAFLAERIPALNLKPLEHTVVTLHEPCKTGYTGLDATSHRRLLAAIPGVELREMPRRGQRTVCCGSGGFVRNAERTAALTRERLAEAAGTGAGTLVTVCHYCGDVFSACGPGALRVTNVLELLERSMGPR